MWLKETSRDKTCTNKTEQAMKTEFNDKHMWWYGYGNGWKKLI